ATASIFALFAYGRFAAQSVALGAAFAALHLYSVARSVRAAYGGDSVSPRARFFVVLRSLRFLSVLAAAALVLVVEWASGVGFLAGYALLVFAIALAPFLPNRDPGRNS
ncbi:MAG: hypothetical protein ACRELY_06625, partial [Polyangiaceae bacterium]